jgi:hypothetical protein
MRHSNGPPETAELGYCAWFAFWGELIALALLAIVGMFFAGQDAVPGDETCGLILAVAAIALAFLRLKHRFDVGDGNLAGFLLVDDMPNLIAVIVVFVILALVGLFVAAGTDHGGLHDGGVALFAASGIAVFLHLKHVFDTLEQRR